MEFHFNAELAKQYGVDGAIFLHCMAFWVAKNRANGRHYHEGRYWTYNTLEALSKLFPFWSRRQLERIINGLRRPGPSWLEISARTGPTAPAGMPWLIASWRSMGRVSRPFHEMVKCISPIGDSHFTKR